MDSHSKRNTILQVLPMLVTDGGAERGTIEVAKQLKLLGHIPIVVSAGGSLVNQLTRVGITHIKMQVDSKNPFILYKNSKLIAQIIKDYKVDLVHARSRAPAWSCYLACKNLKVKFLTTFHAIYDMANLFKKSYNSIMVRGEIVIAVSDFVKEHIMQNYDVAEDRIEVIHRGVDHKYFDPNSLSEQELSKCRKRYNIPLDVPVILLPSRMTSWKGHLTLVKALDKMRDVDCYCLMVGDLSKHPDFVKMIRDLIVKKKLQNKIQIFGNDSDMLPLYALSDIVLSTSIEPESFGRTIIEAQAMKKLVIATNIGGALETIQDNQTGYHVSPGDERELSEKIRYCISILGTQEAINVQNASRERIIKEFSLDLMLNQTFDLYDKICK